MEALDFDLETAIEWENIRVVNPSLVVVVGLVVVATGFGLLALGSWPTIKNERPTAILVYSKIEAAIATAAIAAVSARRMVLPKEAATHPASRNATSS